MFVVYLDFLNHSHSIVKFVTQASLIREPPLDLIFKLYMTLF
jgi:hypothetical protein